MKRRLQEAVRRDKIVSTLEVRETVLEDEVIDAIVDLIWKGNVETVQLDDCGAYMNKPAISMARALGNCKHVRLSEPTFLTTNFLAEFLSTSTKLETLRIQDCLLAPQVEALAKGLKNNKTLRVLDLTKSRFENISALAEGLRENTCLKCIKLRSVGLHDRDVQALIEALESHPSLESLDLSFNHLRNLAPIGRLLRCHQSRLKQLFIGFQNMWQTPRTNIVPILEALRVNTTLKALGIANNKLRDQDAEMMVAALRENKTLECLDVRENIFHDKGITLLAHLAKESNGLRKLYVVKNPFGSDGSLALLEAARENHRIIHMDVCCKNIRYNTTLNRGGRRLLMDTPKPPLGLWPLAMERANKIDWEEEGHMHMASPSPSGMLKDPRIDVLYHFLQESPVIYEGIICESQ
jgi:Ran GTPase-activating protein (RanGAP) involved in mRNA processing and transport